ncbi:hypothetical protein E2C01_019808 [Portunus trituberculatus]|uniref:Uncharacterized protein n=1 Tax=Portunus trituberculatus TaxID=210409 RepID=A0A5B7DYG0_PORTR|nr:hypothetical protein [Portunus trituberculatus]
MTTTPHNSGTSQSSAPPQPRSGQPISVMDRIPHTTVSASNLFFILTYHSKSSHTHIFYSLFLDPLPLTPPLYHT